MYQKKYANTVVAGKTGAGKSTLIGSLLPNQLKHTAVKDGSAYSYSFIFEKYVGQIGECDVTVYDTRGFCAAKTSSEDAQLLGDSLRKEFSAESGRAIDLFIFCQPMFERFNEASLTSLELFGSLLQQLSHWNVCIVALTMANLYPPAIEEAEDPAEAMIAIQQAMKREMRDKYFKPKGLFKEFEQIPFIPVGYRTTKTNRSKLPCSEDSIEDLAKECILRCTQGATLSEDEIPRANLASTTSKKSPAVRKAAKIGLLVGGVMLPGVVTCIYCGVLVIRGALIRAASGVFFFPQE